MGGFVSFFSRLFRWDDQRGEQEEAGLDGIKLDAKLSAQILAELDIDLAISAHENWKARLGSYLQGKSGEDMRPEVICRDDCCDLGKWLYGTGEKRLGELPAYTILVAKHKNFHMHASTVVALVQTEKKEQAERVLSGVFQHTSDQVILLLKALKNSLKG